MRKTTLSAITAGILLSATLFSGCESKDSEVISAFDGKAVDGYLANARVYYENYKDEAKITDSHGNFSLRLRDTKIILEPIYDDKGNCLTIDITTGLPFTKVLSAPAGYPVVTPLTTVLAETKTDVKQLAKSLDLNEISAKKLLKLDPVFVMNSDNYSSLEKEEATKIYTKGVILENQIEILSTGIQKNNENTNEKLDDKSIILESLFNNILDRNDTTFDKISTESLENIYTTARLMKNPNADISSSKAITATHIIASITATLNSGLNDINYTDTQSAYNLSVEIGKGTAELFEIATKLVETNSTSITKDVKSILDAVVLKSEAIVLNAKIDTLIESGTDENIKKSSLKKAVSKEIVSKKDMIQKMSAQVQSSLKLAQKALDSTTLIRLNPAPTIKNLETKIDLNTTINSYSLNIDLSDFNLKGEDVSSQVKYIARIDNNDIISLTDSASVLIDNKAKLNIDINSEGTAQLHLIPIDGEEKVGLEQIVTFFVHDIPKVEKTPLELTTSENSFLFESKNGIPLLTKKDITLTILDKDKDGQLVDVIVNSFDENIVKTSYDKETKIVSLYPVYNGVTQVKVTVIDENYLSTEKIIDIIVQDVSLPPILSFEDESLVTVKNPTENSLITFSYNLQDPDKDDTPFISSINSDNSAIICEDNTEEKTITCTIGTDITKGNYTITATPFDNVIYGGKKTIDLKIFEGNVAPELNLISAKQVTVDAMTTTKIAYKVTDLNKNDSLTVTANSADSSIVTVSIDNNTQELVVIAQPKVGTTTLSVNVSDGKLTDTKTIEFTTINELDKLVSSLKIVPIFKTDDTIFDSRYTMTNFKASYDIQSNSLIINGDVTSDNDVSYPLSDMSLQADTNLSQFGGSDVEKRYALVVDMDVKEAGQSFNARALAFSTNGENIVPYTWALATDTEICNANFSDNVMNLINSSNSDVVNCTKD